MKNKSVTYVLIGVVALIWGVVFYRIFSGMSEDDTSTVSNPYSQVQRKDKQTASLDTFELILDYRDPFLGKVSTLSFSGGSENTVRTIRRKTTSNVTPPPAPPMDWSFVSYLGAIRNKQLNKEIGMFKVHGTDVMMGVNERRGDISVLKVTRDSAVIQYQGVRKMLTKSF